VLTWKTISIDEKTVCGTGRLTKDGSVLHIASALVSDLNLVIGSLECGTKTGEQAAFRDLIALLSHACLEWAVESMHWLLDVHFSEDKTMVFPLK